MKTTPTTTAAAGHTPGKWCVQREFDHEPIYIIAPHSGETIATVERHNDGDPSSDMPNARLIASAPCLLEALQAIEARLTKAANAFYVSGKRSDLQSALDGWKVDANSARAAIARATGGQP